MYAVSKSIFVLLQVSKQRLRVGDLLPELGWAGSTGGTWRGLETLPLADVQESAERVIIR